MHQMLENSPQTFQMISFPSIYLPAANLLETLKYIDPHPLETKITKPDIDVHVYAKSLHICGQISFNPRSTLISIGRLHCGMVIITAH